MSFQVDTLGGLFLIAALIGVAGCCEADDLEY